MALDPSISLRVGQGVTPPANPLATIGQFAGVANSLDQNRLINQYTTNARQQNVGMQQDQGLKSLTATNQILAGLLNNPDLKAGKPITDTIIGSVLQAGQMGVLPPTAIKAALANIPGDAAGQLAWLKGHYDQSEALLGRAGPNTFPQNGLVDTGGGLQPTLVTPGRLGGGQAPVGMPIQKGIAPQMVQTPQGVVPTIGGQQVSGGVPNGMSEEYLNQPMNVVDPNDPTKVIISTRGAAMAHAMGLTMDQVRQRAGLPPAPQAPVVAPNATPQPQPKPFLAGAPMGTEARVNQYVQAQTGAANYANAVNPLKNAYTALQNTTTGPGTETTNFIKSFLNTQGPDAIKAIIPGGVDSIKNYDEAVKYLAQWAAGQPGAQGSDMRTMLSQVANPSTHINQAAAQDVLRNAIGLMRMNVANYHAFQATGRPGSDYPAFVASRSTTLNPMAYSFDLLPRDQQIAVAKSLTKDPAKLNDFYKQVRESESLDTGH